MSALPSSVAASFDLSTIDYRPSVAGLFNIFEAANYTFLFATLELLDNSVSKGSTFVRIRLWQSVSKFLEGFAVIDNGCGMTIADIAHAWLIGRAKARAVGDIGKFHIGMKSALINLGRRSLILSKVVGGPIVGLYADIGLMKANNSFTPTDLCENVTETWAGKYIPLDLFRSFQTQVSGTIIYITDLLPSCQMDGSKTRAMLLSDLAKTYSTLPSDCVLSVQLDAEPETDVVLKDLFYKGREAECLDETPYETVLIAYKGVDERSPMRYFERITQPRDLPKNHALYARTKNASEAHPVLCEYVGTIERGKGKHLSAGKQMHLREVLPTTECMGPIPIRMVCVSTETAAEENVTINVNRKGFHFLRDNVRMVGSARSIGFNMPDRVTMADDHTRALVTFPNTLDKEFGSAFNKQMNNEALPSAVLTDALFTIYAQVKAPWVERGKADAAAAAAKKAAAAQDDAGSTTTLGPTMSIAVPARNAVVMLSASPSPASPSPAAPSPASPSPASPSPASPSPAAPSPAAPSPASPSPLPPSRPDSPSDSPNAEESVEANTQEPPPLAPAAAAAPIPVVAAPQRGVVDGCYVSTTHGLRIPLPTPTISLVEWLASINEDKLLVLATLYPV